MIKQEITKLFEFYRNFTANFIAGVAKNKKFAVGKLSQARKVDRFLLLMFTPAAAFILFGVLAVLAPKFIMLLVASFFITLGIFFGFLAYKFWSLKNKFKDLAKNYQGQVIVQGFNLRGFNIDDLENETQVLFEDEEDEDEDTNIKFH
ncbi:MAG: hypothetical protein KDD56_01200 [Bdellovibrionales bacterium]|nr:hypothetical protein [Bdellovibrionales bacterium]